MDLLERETHWQRLNAVIQNMLVGEGATVLVSGEAGIGKTTFVTAVTDSVEPRFGVPAIRCLLRVYWAPSMILL